jgi:hypothetical protein
MSKISKATDSRKHVMKLPECNVCFVHSQRLASTPLKVAKMKMKNFNMKLQHSCVTFFFKWVFWPAIFKGSLKGPKTKEKHQIDPFKANISNF